MTNFLIKMKKFSKKNTQPSHQTQGEVRIISGRWRGRKLPVLNVQGLRPTGDRVKETLFNWLMSYVVGSHCLDGFSGSGALGIEALSRQASSVTFLELDKAVAKQLCKNLQALNCNTNQAKVINQSCLLFLNTPQNQPHFDLVFLDPPFHFGLAQRTIDLLIDNNWLQPNALIYVETEKEQVLNIPAHWTLLKEKTTGMVTYRLYQS